MATKRYNQESFHIETTEGTYSFYCWTTHTRSGFCHTCWCSNTDQTTKVSYYNRTWESYDYQTALRKAWDKLPKRLQEQMRAWDELKVTHDHEKYEAQFARFKELYSGLTDRQKDAMKNVTLQTEQDVESVMSIMAMANVINELTEDKQ